jgi:hypothetical protein
MLRGIRWRLSGVRAPLGTTRGRSVQEADLYYVVKLSDKKLHSSNYTRSRNHYHR